jgi:hypothetical protein
MEAKHVQASILPDPYTRTERAEFVSGDHWAVFSGGRPGAIIDTESANPEDLPGTGCEPTGPRRGRAYSNRVSRTFRRRRSASALRHCTRMGLW